MQRKPHKHQSFVINDNLLQSTLFLDESLDHALSCNCILLSPGCGRKKDSRGGWFLRARVFRVIGDQPSAVRSLNNTFILIFISFLCVATHFAHGKASFSIATDIGSKRHVFWPRRKIKIKKRHGHHSFARSLTKVGVKVVLLLILGRFMWQ